MIRQETASSITNGTGNATYAPTTSSLDLLCRDDSYPNTSTKKNRSRKCGGHAASKTLLLTKSSLHRSDRSSAERALASDRALPVMLLRWLHEHGRQEPFIGSHSVGRDKNEGRVHEGDGDCGSSLSSRPSNGCNARRIAEDLRLIGAWTDVCGTSTDESTN